MANKVGSPTDWVTDEAGRFNKIVAPRGSAWRADGSLELLMGDREGEEPRRLERRMKCIRGELKLTVSTFYVQGGEELFVVQATFEVIRYGGRWNNSHPVNLLMQSIRLHAAGEVGEFRPHRGGKKAYRAQITLSPKPKDRTIGFR